MGDGALSPTRNGSSARFRWGHGAKQAAYGDWKASLFANVIVSRSTNAKGAVFHDVQPLAELAELREAVYIGGKKVLSDDYLKALTPLSLAVWYMDDGSFTLRSKGLQERTRDGSGRSEICVAAFDAGSQERLRDYLVDTWGIEPRLAHKGVRQVRSSSSPRTRPPSSTRSSHRSSTRRWTTSCCAATAVGLPSSRTSSPRGTNSIPMPIMKIAVKPPTRSMHRFDLEVAGTGNYFADGVMVHNSPETTPVGGR